MAPTSVCATLRAVWTAKRARLLPVHGAVPTRLQRACLRRLSTRVDGPAQPATAAAAESLPDRGMARGTRGARGSGKSLIGSNNKYGSEPGEFTSLTELEGSDMLVEVLAEEFRHKRNLEFQDAELTLSDLGSVADDDEQQGAKRGPEIKGPFMQHRKYLTHRGVGDGTVFSRETMASRNRMETAQELAYDYQLPAVAKAQRDALAAQRKHNGNLVEEAIVRAIADGHFDNLQGRGKPLPDESNPFEDAGMRTFNRILKKAGCAPRWVEENRDVRKELQISRLYLAARWSVLEATAQAVAAADAAGAQAAAEDPAVAQRRRAQHRRAQLQWDEEVAAFSEKVAALNKRVQLYNLMAPTAAAVMQTLSVEREVEAVREGRTVYDEQALRSLSDDGSSFQLAIAAALPSAASAAEAARGDWTGGIALAPLARDSFSLSGQLAWPRWRDIISAFRFT